jgi:imidazolonepropionase-like amidohydrolase
MRAPRTATAAAIVTLGLLPASCTHPASPTPAPSPAISDADFGSVIDEAAIEALVDRVSREHAAGPPLAFEHVAVVSLAHPGVDRDQTIVVRDGKIAAVGPAASVAIPAGATVIPGAGRYVMPGLTDMHVHTELSTSNYLLDLANGVTSVREMNGSPWLLRMRERERANQALIPNLYVAGPILAAMPFGESITVVTTPGAARAEVRAQRAAGYEFIKVHNVVPAPIYAAICEEARAQHLDVVGHIPHDTTIATAIACGQRTFEHFKSYIDDHTLTLTHEDYVAATRGADVWNTPTFETYRSHLRGDDARRVLAMPEMRYVSARDRAAWLALADEPAKPIQQGILTLSEQIFRALLPIGAHFLAGTDSGGGYPYMVRGFALHDELRIMAEQGMPIADVLRTATVEPQRAMRRDDAGTIEVGKRADLLLLHENPLDAIANLAAIDGVAVRGRWLDRATLDHILDDIAQIYTAHPAPTRADLDRAITTLEQLRDRGDPLRDPFLTLLQVERSEAATKKSRKKNSP